eukprot:sb/3465860/
MVVTLGYWGIRALGEPARLILRYADADWTETTIPPTKEGAGMWFGGLKQSLGLDFPNLPYLIDGEVKLTESTAIYRYLGRKYNLMPGDAIRGDLAEQLVTGLRTYITKIAYSGEFEKSLPRFVTLIKTRLTEFTKFLGDGPFLFGDKHPPLYTMELGYWALRGLGEPSRLLLRYKGVEFNDATIPLTEEGAGKWFGETKESLGLDFPNLPYLIDGDVKLTESLAIMRYLQQCIFNTISIRYLGRKYDMMPDDLAKGDMMELVIQSQRMDLGKISYSADFENLKEGFITKLKVFLERFAKFVVKPFIFGSKVTYIDILAYEYLDHIRALTPESFTGEVSEYLQRVADLPNIAAWLKSELTCHCVCLLLK